MINNIKRMFSRKKEKIVMEPNSHKGLMDQSFFSNVAVDSSEQDLNVKTSISLHETWIEKLNYSEKYSLGNIQESLQPLKKSQVALVGYKIELMSKGLLVTGFIRNGLDVPLKLEEIPLIIVSKDDKVIARKVFNFREIGDIPAYSDRPWKFLFENEVINFSLIGFKEWKIAFDINEIDTLKDSESEERVLLDLGPNWANQINESDFKGIEKLLDQLPLKNSGLFEVITINFDYNDDKLSCLTLLSNSTNEDRILDGITLMIEDLNGNELLTSSFNLNNKEIKSNTATPWRFTFSSHLELKQGKWKLLIKDQNA